MFLNRREMELRKVRFEETFRPGEIEFFDKKLWQAGPMSVAGVAELLPNTGGEIRIRGSLRVVMEAECDRCLDVAQYPLDLAFDLFYEPLEAGPESPEVALEAADSSVDFYEGEGLELENVLREQVLLALPMQRTCRENCQGICPICGQNRNRVACGCKLVTPDDRWAALRNL